jgi:hypothetical protein
LSPLVAETLRFLGDDSSHLDPPRSTNQAGAAPSL